MIGAALLSGILVVAMPQQRGTQPTASVEVIRDLVGRGDLQRAQSTANQLVLRSPENAEAWYLLGIIRAGLNDIGGAIDAYRQAARNNPRHADAWNNLGDLLRRTGQLKDARSAIEQGRLADPKDPRLALNLALVQIQLQDFPGALSALTDVEAANGPSALTHYLRARTYLEDGQVAKAQPHLDRFRSSTPQDAEAFVGLAKLLLAREAYPQAAELLLALKPESRSAAMKFTLGQAYYAMEQMENAHGIFAELAASHPAVALYQTWAGHASRALGATGEARSAYESAVRADGASVEALTELASLELDEGNSERAEGWASRALSHAPDNAHTQFVAGQVFFRLQKWTDAIGAFLRIRPEDMDYAQAQYMLSRSFLKTGDAVAAEAALAEFNRITASAGTSEPPKRKRVNPN